MRILPAPRLSLNRIRGRIENFRGKVGRIPLLCAALALAAIAQQSITPQPILFAGVLIAAGAIYFYHLQSTKAAARENRLLILLVSLILLLAFFIPNFLRGPLLFSIAAILFLSAFSPTETVEDELFSRWELFALGFILLSAFILLAYDLENIPPGVHGDEGETGMQALAILQGKVGLFSVGWYHLPILSFLWPAISLQIFGDSIFGLRISTVFAGMASLIPTYLLSRLLFGRSVALLATTLMATGNWFIAYNRLGLNNTETTLFEVSAFYFLWQAIRSRSLRDWALAGIFVGGGLYLYWASRLVPFLVVLFLLFMIVRRFGFWRENWRGIVILFLAALLVFLPLGLYFLKFPIRLFSREQFVFLFSNPANTERFIGTSDPGLAFLVQVQRMTALFNYGEDQSGQYGYEGSLLDFLSAIFLVLGVSYALVRIRDPRFLFISLWFWLTLFVGGVLTLPSPFTTRLVGMMPVVYILAALALSKILSHLSGLFSSQNQRRLLVAVSAVTLGTIAYSNYQIYFVDYIHSLDGWAQLEPATTVAKYIRERREGYYFYLLGKPRLYLTHGTIRFLARHYQGSDVEDPEKVIPLTQPPPSKVAFILLPEYLEFLPNLQEQYPQGKEEVYLRSDGRIWFVAFEIPRGTLPQNFSQKE